MPARTSRRRPSGQQLCFSDDFFDTPLPAPARSVTECTAGASRRLPVDPPPVQAPPAFNRSDHDDFTTPANAYEMRARLRNSLTALSTATLLMVRHAPDSKVVGELSAIMRRQITLLTCQIQTLEDIASHCESAEL